MITADILIGNRLTKSGLDRIVADFRARVEDGIPCEADGDIAAIWVVADSSPQACRELLANGLGSLFPTDAVLPTVDTLQRVIQGEW